MALSVFPERMNKLDTSNPEQSLNTIENYITYMTERVEFSLTNLFKTVQGAGVSSAEMLVMIAALSNSLGALTGTVNQIQGAVTALQQQQRGVKTWYATCDTAAATAAKVVATSTGDFVLATGAQVRVKFANANSYNGTATLNVDGTGAIDVVRVGTTKTVRYFWSAGETIDFVYDGTNWAMSRTGIATTTYYGLTKLVTSGSSTSTSTALTPASMNNLVMDMITGIPNYSSSSTYAVGDRVRYGYYIYECNTPITTAESWTVAHWTALGPLLGMIEDNESRITTLESALTAAGPILYTQPQDQTVALGDSAVFSVQVLGASTYKWEHYYSSTWVEVGWTGHDTSEVTTPATTALMDGRQIRCTITGGGWTIVSQTATLHVT